MKIYSAMIAVMRDITSIGKSSKNVQQGFNFRGIDAVYNELHNLLAKHGIVTLPQAGTPVTEERVNMKGTTLRFVQIPMTYQFVADDGSSITCQVIGEGMDSGDKATNKAMAIAHKYALLQTFLIPTEEQKDPDSETHEVAPRVAKSPVREVSKEEAKATATWKNVEITNIREIQGKKSTFFCVEFDGKAEALTFDKKLYATATDLALVKVDAGVAPGKNDPSKWQLISLAPTTGAKANITTDEKA